MNFPIRNEIFSLCRDVWVFGLFRRIVFYGYGTPFHFYCFQWDPDISFYCAIPKVYWNTRYTGSSTTVRGDLFSLRPQNDLSLSDSFLQLHNPYKYFYYILFYSLSLVKDCILNFIVTCFSVYVKPVYFLFGQLSY